MELPLYEQVANHIEQQIQEGIFLPGEKVPSVRKLSKQLEVSVATILQAYSLLEDRGVMKARPQKGYFVQDTQPLQPTSLDTPELQNTQVLSTQALSTQAQASPTQSSQEQVSLLKHFLLNTQDKTLIPFGTTSPSSHFLPIRQLQRSVGRLMRLSPELCVEYGSTPGLLELRRQIAIRMLDSGCQVQPDDITITQGCQNGLVLSLQSTAQSGDLVAIESPTYHGTLHAIESLNLKAVEIPCSAESGINLKALEKAAKKQAIKVCIVTPTNQNPTGATLTKQKRKALIALANKYQFTIIEDDVYGELSYSEKRERTLKADDHNNHVIYCSSFSKSVAPGFRVGWVIGGHYQARIEHLAYIQALATPTITQVAIANFLENGAYDRHLRKTRTTYQSNLKKYQQTILSAFPEGTQFSTPSGGFLLWVTLPDTIDIMTLHADARDNKIDFLPGLVFSTTANHKHHLRLNYALNWDNYIEQALKTLGELCLQQILH